MQLDFYFLFKVVENVNLLSRTIWGLSLYLGLQWSKWGLSIYLGLQWTIGQWRASPSAIQGEHKYKPRKRKEPLDVLTYCMNKER